MSGLTSNRLWGSVPDNSASQYARMIPGTSTPSSIRLAPVAVSGPGFIDEAISRGSTAPRAPAPHRPHIFPEQFRTYQFAATDLIVLGGICATLSLQFPSWGLPRAYVPIFAVLVMLFGLSEGLYQRNADLFSSADLILILSRATLLATGLVFIAAREGISPLVAARIFATSLIGLVLLRPVRRSISRQRRPRTDSRKVLIIGGGQVGRSIARAMRNDSLQTATVCGFIDDDEPLSPAVLGRIADLDWIARAEFIDEVILALPGRPDQMRKAAEAAFRNHLDIRAVPDLPPGPWADSNLERIGEVPVVILHRELLPSAALFVKVLLDFSSAALLVLLASPLFALVALLVRLDSPGSVIYCAERTGAKGRRFRCFKFRSMVTDAAHLKEDLRAQNQREGPIFKIDDDPRITRIGRILRRYSLDELPQLWNVLRGEMSLVGPRPHPVDEVNHYELHHFRRLDVKPGITGLWQITARDCPSFELNMHLDLTYIENWSLLLDLRILANTIGVLFAPKGA